MAADELLLFYYYASTGVESVVAAPSKARAAKLLGTTAKTLPSLCEIYSSIGQVPRGKVAPLKKALAKPQVVFIKSDGQWVQLAAPADEVLVSDKQLQTRAYKNRALGDTAMRTHSIRTSDESWAKYLVLGGSQFFRDIVDVKFDELIAQDPEAAAARLQETLEMMGSKS